MPFEERLARQLLIADWDQQALDTARVGVVGDGSLLTSLYLLSAAALGINRVVAVAPRLDERLVVLAHRVNSRFSLSHLQGFYTHPLLADMFAGCGVVVDLSSYGLANKLLLAHGFKNGLPVVRGFCWAQGQAAGFRVFTYLKGREWAELEQLVSPRNLPAAPFHDGVLEIIASGLALEETKNVLMGRSPSTQIIAHQRKRVPSAPGRCSICVVGAGALGTFVGLGLAYAGFRDLTFIDPDVVEETNLNRQVLFAEAVGRSKAETLSARLNAMFALHSRAQVGYFGRDTDISPYDVFFDCVDNFAARIVLSERCKDEKKILISGGTSPEAGQVVVYDPGRHEKTPAQLLGLADLVAARQPEAYRREREACRYQPDPSVIMTNQIIAGFMVESLRLLNDDQEAPNIFYEASQDMKIS